MTDRELLDLAAKAAGIDRLDFGNGAILTNDEDGHTVVWNPLTDDGDALRLAARLRLQITAGKHPGDGCTVESQRSGIAGCTAFRDDKAEQMRRAIVHVAAEIGRAVEPRAWCTQPPIIGDSIAEGADIPWNHKAKP